MFFFGLLTGLLLSCIILLGLIRFRSNIDREVNKIVHKVEKRERGVILKQKEDPAAKLFGL